MAALKIHDGSGFITIGGGHADLSNHISNDGTDHSNVVLNDTHRNGDGSDHSLLSAPAGTAEASKAPILGISKQSDTVIASTELISGDINVEIDPTPVTVDLVDKTIRYYRGKGDKTCVFGSPDLTLVTGTEQYTAGPPQMWLFNDLTNYAGSYLPGSSAISISFLMRLTAAAVQGVVGIGDGSGTDHITLRLQSDGTVRLLGSGVTARNGTKVHDLNTLYHIVITIPANRDWDSLEVYTDGVADAGLSTPGGTSTLGDTGGTSVIIGLQANGGTNFFTGNISDVAIYEHASDVLTQTEVTALYNGQRLLTNFGGDVSIGGGIDIAGGSFSFDSDGNILCNDAFVIQLEIDGALNHDGTTAGFYGTIPVAQAGMMTVSDTNSPNSGDATTDAIILNLQIRVDELEDMLSENFGGIGIVE